MKQFGALKAIGVTNRRLVGIILLQAFTVGAISLAELDRRRFGARTLRARVAQAEAAAKASETEIARSRVTAPIDGEILKLDVRAGEFAAAGTTPLLLLGCLVPLHLRVDVDEQDAWRVESRAKAVAAVRGNPSQQTTLEFVRFEPSSCQSGRSQAAAPNAWTRAFCKSSAASSPTDSRSTPASKWMSSLKLRLFPRSQAKTVSRISWLVRHMIEPKNGS